MKKNICFILLLILGITTNGCKNDNLKDDEFIVDGTTRDINAELFLYDSEGERDTIVIKNGSFKIEGKTDRSVVAFSLFKPVEEQITKETYIPLFLEPGHQTLKLDYDDFSNSKLKGSKTQDEYYQLENDFKEVEDNYQSELNRLEEIRKQYQQAATSGASPTELAEIKNDLDEINKKLHPYYKMRREKELEFIKNNPQSYVSLTRLQNLQGLGYEDANELYGNLNDEFKNTKLGESVKASIENLKKGIPGSVAYNFQTVDINGDSLALEDFKGNYVLLDFWASWCVPCRKGNPHLRKLYKKYHPKGFEIIGVSDDDSTPEKWRAAVEKDTIGIWHHVLRGLKRTEEGFDRTNDISGEKYNIRTLPTKILVDSNGKILKRYDELGGDDNDLDQDLQEIYGD